MVGLIIQGFPVRVGVARKLIGCTIWKELWSFFIITDTATDYPYIYADSETIIGGLCLPWI